MKNALSVDLEDWFCAYNLSAVIPLSAWGSCELRAMASTRRILDLLDRHRTPATFFVLGWIAERLPDLIREIDRRGHEIAVHGYRHILLTAMSPEEFEADVTRTLDILRGIGVGQRISGFRAPSFTIVRKTEWAFDVLGKLGFEYDSSVFPVGFHPDYGIPDAPLAPYRVNGGLIEFPISCIEVAGRRIPCGGGGYFRLLPYVYTKYCLRRCNAEGRCAVFYVHPWELDPGQPRMPIPLTRKVRHYYGLAGTERKLERLLNDFQFTTIRNVLNL